MMRILLCALALVSPFLFPWPVTVALVFIIALLVPPISFFAGLLTDAAYYASGNGALPLATLLGALGFIVAVFVHRFIKTRIISG